MALYPTCHKTVFVMDHGPYFALPCQQVEYDVGRRTGPGFIPLTPITKTVWTVAVEAVSEYCRLVWDIFPRGDRLIRVVVGSQPGEGERGEEWAEAGQTVASMLELLAAVGRPSTDTRDNSVVAGARRAMELLCQPSPRQLAAAAAAGDQGPAVVNRGRVVIVTALESDARYQQLVAAVQQQLELVNKETAAAGAGQQLLPLAEVEVSVVHTQPSSAGDIGLRTEQDTIKRVTPVLSTVLHSAIAGPTLANKLLSLCLSHYQLASTTVTGIPMKEEQNASSSANYDVELFHVGEAHQQLLGDSCDLPLTKKEDCEYMTATLKWCTPRGSAGVELHHTSGAYRITPTEVNSRQSSCLTNFLLSGRSVMLEMQKRVTGTKIISHMLTSHGGEIFIHTLSSAAARSTLEDPPSISEGPGGRVTDYRINDLGILMQTHRLAPWPGSGSREEAAPATRARQLLDRATRVFPVTISATTIFNMPQVAPLVNLLQQESLPEDGVAECQKVIYNLIGMENKGESLPSPLTSATTGKKSGRKEEQYRLMFQELERFVVAHSGNSARHHQVLECLMQVRNKPMPAKREADTELSVASRELDRYQSMSDRERLEYNKVQVKEEPGVKVEPAAKKQRMMGLGGKNLLQIYRERLEREAAKKHVEFAGRRNLGDIAKLYIKMAAVKEEEVA